MKVRGVKHTDNITVGLNKVHDLESPEQMMSFLKAGRADIALSHSLTGMKALNRLGYSAEIIPAGPPLDHQPLYNYIHRNKRYLVPRINRIIIKMKKSGELDQRVRDARKEVLDRYRTQ